MKIVSRKDAKAAGLTLYFTGLPCNLGLTSGRLVSNGACSCAEHKRAAADNSRARYAALCAAGKAPHKVNPDRSRAANRKAYEARMTPAALERKRAREADPEAHSLAVAEKRKVREAARSKRNAGDPDRLARKKHLRASKNLTPARRAERLAYNKKWLAENPHVKNANKAARRARKLNATPAWDAELTALVTIEAADLARRRALSTGFAWHVDHIVPLRGRTVCGLHAWSNLQVIPAVVNLRKGNRLDFATNDPWIAPACA